MLIRLTLERTSRNVDSNKIRSHRNSGKLCSVSQVHFRECIKHFDIVVSERPCFLNPICTFKGVYLVHVLME
jgi:hypothetical protein